LHTPVDPPFQDIASDLAVGRSRGRICRDEGNETTLLLHPMMLKPLFSLFIGYFRWTQLFPMIVAWVIGTGLLLIFFITSDPDASGQLIESVGQRIANTPVVGEAFGALMEYVFSEEEANKPFFEAFRSVVLKAWGLASLVFMLLAWLLDSVFGPFKPWTLKNKLKVTLVACLALVAGYIACFLANPDAFNGPTSRTMLNFLLTGAVVFIVSTWSLTISHLLGKWQLAEG